MKGYEVYQLYNAISLHFKSEKYDFFKYNGKTNITPNAWYNRSDKYHFEKIGATFQRDEIIGIIVSAFTSDPTSTISWGGELLDNSKNGYLKWRGKIESLSKTFEEDLYYLKNYADQNLTSFKKLFVPISNSYPIFVQMLINKEITYESAIIFNELTGVFCKLDERIPEDVIWNEYKNLFVKYRSFLKVDKQEYGKIVKKVLK